MKAVKNRILVKVEENEKTAGGIIIPDAAKEKSFSGKVVTVGRDVEDIKTDDEVYFNKLSGVELTLNGHKMISIKDSDVLAVM